MAQWISTYTNEVALGSIGFLSRVDRHHLDTLTQFWYLTEAPKRTNENTTAMGLVQVVRTTKDGSRAFVRPVSADSPEGRAFLKGAGYPELVPQVVEG